MIVKKNITLASGSPRRFILMKQIGLRFDVCESGIDENFVNIKSPVEHVTALSKIKASTVGEKIKEGFIISADTVVVIDGIILGKPSNRSEAANMLATLSSRTHKVYTGFTILDKPSGTSVTEHEITSVTFRKLHPDEINEYVLTGSPMDKAGAYGIQDDYGAVFVEKIDGCFYNVVGFPLTKFYLTMMNFQKQLGLI